MNMKDTFAALRGEAQSAAKEEEEKSNALVPSSSAVVAAEKKAPAAHSSDESLMVVKGASEQILAYSDKYMLDGVVYPMTQAKRDEIAAGILKLSSMGERVLGFAELPLDKEKYNTEYAYTGSTRTTLNVPFCQEGVPDSGLIFIGLMAMVDPPRQGVAHAVLTCKLAGIKVIMVRERTRHTRHTHSSLDRLTVTSMHFHHAMRQPVHLHSRLRRTCLIPPFSRFHRAPGDG
jgi:hypothetical protein